MIHSNLEESLTCHCPNCGNEHNAKVESKFQDKMHYMVGHCETCGYEIVLRDDELGGGLFMPDGSTVKDVFKKESTEHMKRDAEGKVEKSFATMKFRFLDDEPIVEERER